MICASYLTDPITLTWKKLVEASARRIATQGFNRLKLVQAMCDCRCLSRLAPDEFFPELTRCCAAAGVAVVLVPELKGQKASCAHGWLSPRTAWIGTTLRYKRDDHFWFCLYHAAAHLIYETAENAGGQRAEVGSQESEVSHQKDSADLCSAASQLAADLLIPWQAARDLVKLESAEQIQTFAKSLAVGDGIVVGQMQFRKIITYRQFNELKRKLDFDAALVAQEAACSTWLSVKQAALLLKKDLPSLDHAKAKSRVSTAATRGFITDNGQSWQKRRLDPQALDAWRLQQRNRDLDRDDDREEYEDRAA